MPSSMSLSNDNNDVCPKTFGFPRHLGNAALGCWLSHDIRSPSTRVLRTISETVGFAKRWRMESFAAEASWSLATGGQHL